MSNNLLELLKEHLSGDVVSNIAALIGESPKNTESALQTALPSLLAGLVEKGSDANNIGSLFDILVKGTHDGGILSNLGALSRGGEETTKLVSEGGSLLASLFGDKVSGIVDLVANASGISKNSSSSLLNFVTPVVLGLIGKHLKIGHTENAAGLAGLLGDQSGFLKNLIPGDAPASAATAATHALDVDQIQSYVSEKISSATETLVNLDDTIEDVAEETLSSAKHIAEEFSESATQFGSHIVEESKEFAHSAADAIEEGTGGGSKILPWLLIAAALALVWGLLKSCSAPETPPTATAPSVTAPPVTTPPPAEPVVAAPQPAPATPEPAKVEAPATDSNFFEKTLASGYAIKSAKDGFVSKLMGYIEGNEPINDDLWFTMDGITFDTNKATIKAESAAQISDIAEILKAFPKVKIKIGGYTDNTGKANANKKLSDNRANAVKKALVSKDIKGDRIDGEGYGSDHPVASNDTAEGRQQNRRIDVRVTEK